MDKFGYQPEDKNEKIKTASETGVCPVCGKAVNGNPPICPIHGSEPFESTNGQEKRK